MSIKSFHAALVAGAAFFLGAVASVHAEPAMSPATKVFLENLSPNVDYLDQASRLALTNSKSAKLREFARGEAMAQTLAANALYDWKNGTTAVASADAPMQTGRSAAVDIAPDTRMAMGQEQLDALYGLDGKEFDEAYKSNQRDALTQVQTDYETYLAKGDDAALKALATKELPKVKHQIEMLAKL